ncbi:fibronectin type III domain-containing protein 4-like isoform X2 [Thalassophryne amazonica]|uniref:fibronectin type III domain-containing protein 4-like isoform X2 n=1 Tax=Thalassophryne amazonica TaxID=390379 RepID=UPI0014722721|nr:fibronectin type III domain-containing protein 4-like isoform X2 [Thalassophryne amazonica]
MIWMKVVCGSSGDPAGRPPAKEVQLCTETEVMSSFLHLDLRLLLLLACWKTPRMVGGTVPAAPVNVSVTQLRAHSAMVTWNIPQGDIVIGYSISQQRQDGLMQRSIREVNTTSHWCVLWDLDEDTHYSVQVQSVGLHGDSQPSRAIHFRTLERTDHYPAGVLDHHEPAMEGLGMTPHLQTGELLIITTVLLLWAAVIALFCRQYDIIKDSDTNGTKDKVKRPLVRATSSYYNASTSSSPMYHNGAVRSSRLNRASSSISIIRV